MRLAHALLLGLSKINVGRADWRSAAVFTHGLCARERGKKQRELFFLLFSAFVSASLQTPNIWGKRRQERHDSEASRTVQDAGNEQPVDKMWVSCARSERSPRRFGATQGSDEMRARPALSGS